MLPGFGRRWGKKRDTQKIVRDMSCSCTMCDPFDEGISETEMTKRGMYTTISKITVVYDSSPIYKCMVCILIKIKLSCYYYYWICMLHHLLVFFS